MENFFDVPKEQQIAFRYFVRPGDTWTLETVHQVLMTYSDYLCHIVSYETDAERPHYQGYLCIKNPDKDLNKSRKWFKKTFGNPKGNEDYSWVRVKNPNDYKKYLLKEGQWLSNGRDTAALMKYQLISYPKKKKFQEELDSLEIEYLDSNMSDEQYIFNFMKLKGKYRQVINTNYIKQRLLMLISRKDDGRLKDISITLANEVKYLELKKNFLG